VSVLRIRDWKAGVRDVLGPGDRAVVWVQGCSLRCPGCMVPETWAPSGGQAVDPVALAHEILAAGRVDGVTVSGGEPMEQPAAVAELLAPFRAAGKDVWVYSGYTLEELLARDDVEVDRVLSLADVLVDGRYDRARPAATGYRGSANQRILSLSGRGDAPPVPEEPPPRVQLTLDGEGRLVVVGVPPPGFLKRFKDAMERRGTLVRTDRTWDSPGDSR
jgi:anaerobic ribonucleoside-triphosphate reductase activating protein